MAAVLKLVSIGVKVVLLVCLIGLSLAVTITIALLKGDFQGECPLYPHVEDGYIYLYQVSNCNFIIGLNSVASFIALAAVVYVIAEVVLQRQLVKIDLLPFILAIIYFGVGCLVLISACIVSVGFNKLCKELEDHDRRATCRDYQNDDWTGYDGSHFYDYLLAAETSSWLSFGMWVSLGVVSLLALAFCNKK